APRQHADSDNRVGVVVANSDKVAVAIANLDPRAGDQIGWFHVRDCLRENPWVPTTYRTVTSGAQKDTRARGPGSLGARFTHRAGKGDSPGGIKSPLRPPCLEPSRIGPISIARSMAFAMS